MAPILEGIEVRRVEAVQRHEQQKQELLLLKNRVIGTYVLTSEDRSILLSLLDEKLEEYE